MEMPRCLAMLSSLPQSLCKMPQGLPSSIILLPTRKMLVPRRGLELGGFVWHCYMDCAGSRDTIQQL